MLEKFKTNAEVIEAGDKYLYGNHIRMPLSMERGEGCWVFDKDGNKYLDYVGGIAIPAFRSACASARRPSSTAPTTSTMSLPSRRRS